MAYIVILWILLYYFALNWLTFISLSYFVYVTSEVQNFFMR